MNNITNGVDPEDIKSSSVGGLMNAAKFEPNALELVLTGSGKSRSTARLNGITGSVKVTSPTRQGIDDLKDANLNTRFNYVKNSEFFIEVQARAVECYR